MGIVTGRYPIAVSNTGVRPSVLLALAIGCAVSVSSIYFLQPLLEVIGKEFGYSADRMSIVAMMVQVGYVGAMLFVAPLGDFIDRPKLINTCFWTATAGLLLVSVAPNLPLLCVTAFLLGLGNATPQILVPTAAGLADPAKRGRVVGVVMAGLMVGILGGRIIAGALVGVMGWRLLFVAWAIFIRLYGFMLGRVLSEYHTHPAPRPYREIYGELFSTLKGIAKSEWRLRYSCWFGACSFAAFSAFWTTLSYHLQEPPLNYGAAIAGSFGGLGIIGAAAAPLAGVFADRKLEHMGNLLSLALLGLSFVLLHVLGWTLFGLVVGVVVLDFAASFNHTSNQSRNYALRPDATSRVNTLYMSSYFIGGSLGSILGGMAWTNGRWPGVCLLGVILSVVGLLPAIPYARMRPTESGNI